MTERMIRLPLILCALLAGCGDDPERMSGSSTTERRADTQHRTFYDGTSGPGSHFGINCVEGGVNGKVKIKDDGGFTCSGTVRITCMDGNGMNPVEVEDRGVTLYRCDGPLRLKRGEIAYIAPTLEQ